MSDAKSLRALADRAANHVDPAAEAPPAIQMEQVTVTITSTGRPFIAGFPVDMSEPELLEVVGWMANQLRAHLAQRRLKTAGGRIILPGRH